MLGECEKDGPARDTVGSGAAESALRSGVSRGSCRGTFDEPGCTRSSMSE